MPRIKKFIFSGTGLIISFYISALFALGIIFGYLATRIFDRKFIKKGRIKMIRFNFGEWHIHLHHWLMGVLVIFFIYVVNLLPYLPIFYLGVLGGLILHDIYSDKDWYKIVYKKRGPIV